MPAPERSLTDLRRPVLLMQAVARALPAYLQRAARSRAHADPQRARARLEALYDSEAALEAVRRSGDIRYSVAAHITALLRLIAEARLLAQTLPPER